MNRAPEVYCPACNHPSWMRQNPDRRGALARRKPRVFRPSGEARVISGGFSPDSRLSELAFRRRVAYNKNMIRTRIIPCRLPRAVCDALNAASGAIYTGVLVWHWRTYRRRGHWLSESAARRWDDWRGSQPLHAHTVDAAQEGFYRACAVTRALRQAGFPHVRFPYHRRRFRTTIWKVTGIRRKGDTLVLSGGRGNRPIAIPLPVELRAAPRFLEVRLVYDRWDGATPGMSWSRTARPRGRRPGRTSSRSISVRSTRPRWATSMRPP
jgi:hypothetical protein